MFSKRKLFAMLLSVVLAVSLFMGNTNLAATMEVFAAEVVNAPENLSLKETDAGVSIKWDRYNNAARYDVYRAKSRYGDYQKVTTVEGVSWTDTNPNKEKYENYYKIAVEGSNNFSNPISLEIEMFGEDMYVFSPEDDIEKIYNAVNAVYKVQGDVNANGNAGAGQQFGTGRYAFAFKSGDYSQMAADQFNMSYYMQLLGLGKLPTDVIIKNVHVPPVLADSNVTCNFWMGIENLSIAPVGFNTNDAYFDFQWSVSQAAPARRLDVKRSTRLNYMWDGWASGGYVADSVIHGDLGSWSQQQYYLRNNNVQGDLYGINWNLVTQGCTGMNGSNWNNTVSKFPMYQLESGQGKTNWKSGGKYTILNYTDALREKPFLYFDEDINEYKVFAPSMRKNSKGTSWSANSMGEGKSLDIDEFYIARADRDNAASINAALNAGKNIILSPGIYYAEEPIHITKADTIVLGLGLATIIPTNKETAIKIADVDGVTVAGVILDADSDSKNMIVAGEEGCNRNHASNPTILQDVFIRVGGVHGGVASTEQAMVINSNDVIGDHFWIWRADHGAGVGWNLNKAGNGVVVNGDNVTLYGLMVEHFQEYDVLWRGENGKTYFLQNEKCYDPQNQDGWMSHDGTVLGYAAYKVANNVKNHYAVGLGSYDVFINTNGASIFLENAIEVPNTEGVMIENACTVEIANGSGPIVGFNNIVNGTGPAITTGAGSGGGYARQALLLYNNGKGTSLQDYYITGGNEAGIIIEETGITPTDDSRAEKDIVKEESKEEPTEEPTEEPKHDSVATGPYADWKNNTVTYPEKGQLVASGAFDIQFGQLSGAKQYDVYVDEKLVKTISGAEANEASFSVEVKSVDVKKHTTYVVATLENNGKVTSNIRHFFISKKGMGIWQEDVDKIKETNLSWYYTWSIDELSGVSKQVEFVPMLWGDFGRGNSREAEWLKNGGYKDYKYLLTFNEPDMPDQSNMTPERVVELWPELEKVRQAGVSVSSPGTAVPTVLYGDTNNAYNTVGGWYGKYDQLMVKADYHDDFTAVHFYFDYPGEFVLDIIKQIHERTGKPIWITEWGVGQWTQVQNFDWTGGPDEGNWQRDIIVDFMESVIPKLDQLDYVERYAWFPFDGSDTTKFGNGASGLFFRGENDPLKGQLTSLGKTYAKVGNPEGYDADKIVDDIVVADENIGEIPTEKPTEEQTAAPTEKPTEEPTVAPTEKPTETPTEVPTKPVPKVNIVLGKKATASTELGGNVAANAVDGNQGGRWETIHDAANPQWIQIELGGTYKVNGFKTNWETAAAKEYQFQVSMDGTNWNTVADVKDGKSGETREESFAEAEAKYVRILCTSKTTGYGYSIWELEVYGSEVGVEKPTEQPTEAPTEKPTEPPVEPVEKTNVVSGKTATASTSLGSHTASNAIDGNEKSRWETIHEAINPQWIQIDLGGTYQVDSFKVVWEIASAKEYQFQVSMNGTDWQTVYDVKDGKEGETREGSFAKTEAKYVRILCTTKATIYGYSIWELEVYGSRVSTEEPTEPPTEKPTEPTIDPAEKINVVSGKTASTSNVYGANVAANAIDKNWGSRWETAHGKDEVQWIQIDLNGTYVIDSFKIDWETAAAKEYQFQVSMDGVNWSTVCNVADGKSGESREESFAVTTAKYVRILCTSKTTQYGYSIWELEVYGSMVK